MGPRVTPWRDDDEWNCVKSWFYCRDDGSIDTRLQALGRVRAWTVRGRVPHAVTSTAMLTAALMRDQIGDQKFMDARMLIAMALTRFVNGLLDPAQQAVFAISMSSLAKSIGLPEAFVEIRHSATHDSLPSLPVLRSALLRALDWLWNHYWNAVPRARTREHSAEEKQALLEKFSSILKTWRKLRKSDPSRAIKSGDADPFTKQSITLLRDIKSIKDGPVAVEALSEALLGSKYLLSTTSGSFVLWQPLLGCAFNHYTELRNKTIIHGIAVLGSQKAIDTALHPTQQYQSSIPSIETQMPDVNGSYDRLRAWILELISLDNSGAGKSLDKNQITKALALATDKYTLQIMEAIQNEPGYEKVPRLLALRKGQDQLDTHIRSENGPAAGEVSSANGGNDAKDVQVDAQKVSIWRKTNSKSRPIGHLSM